MLTRRDRPSWAPAYEPWAIEQENVYAHRKRLWFIIRAIEALRIAQGKLPADLTILDVGCGTGIMITLPLASIGYSVTGIDIYRPSIDIAGRLNPYHNAVFRQADPVALAEAGERYDAVIASEVLEHVEDPFAFLRTLRRLLRPGGIMVLTTPNGFGWFELEQLLWDDLGLGKWIRWWDDRWTALTDRVGTSIRRVLGRPAPAREAAPWESMTSTGNAASPHLQHFRWARLKHLVALAGLRVIRDGKSALISGRITHTFLGNRRWFIRVNATSADLFPHALVAGWYLVCQADPSRPTVLCLSDSGLKAQARIDLAARFGVEPTALISFRELRRAPRVALGLPWRQFDAAVAFLPDLRAPLYRDVVALYVALLRARHKSLRDTRGTELPIRTREGIKAFGQCLGDLAGFPLLYGYGRWNARRLSRGRPSAGRRLPLTRRVAYLRANLWQESKAGGSVAHTTGVLSGLRAAGMDVTYVGTADFPPARRLGAEVSIVHPRLRWMRNFPDLPFLAYSDSFARHCCRLFRERPPDFVYQRYSVFNSAGAWTARHLGCPFVLEYNGPEVWVARHWGTRLFFEQLGDRVERANLVSADLVIVVSDALRDEVMARGVPPDRVLVNPNAVDPARYHPGIDGGPVQKCLGMEGRLVIGFIGTFGLWHGAEVLARAVRPVTEALPQAHVLFVGDGSTMPKVREIVAGDGVGGRVTFTGLVAQDQAPGYLAACDLLVSPHVGNPDGSRFFGSPTKLFEYMAMGKGIVASDLDQIGTILTHGKTGWLVPPGDVGALAKAIVTLAQDPELRRKLGEAAREEVVRQHTWTAHVERILAKLVESGLLPEHGRGSHAA
jgi:glycosyltransferase involved in cell wall biosynthesis/SAM-dependent methyltransferase